MMSELKQLRFLLALAIVVSVFVAMPAMAQDAGSDLTEAEEAVEESTTGIKVEEIVVTARRRAENLQDVPIAVSVINGGALEDVQASNISEIQQYVPNLSIYQGRNQSTTMTAFVRGVGQADPLWGVDPGVGLYLDDVFIARPQGALLDVMDVERVEVLRGPQGTLYGKNTIGGAIKYVSRGMRDEWNGNLTVNPGTVGTLQLRASAGGAIVPGVFRMRAAVASLKHDGYGRNLYQDRDVSNEDTLAYRLGFELLPSDNTSLKLSWMRTEDNAEPVGLTRLEANQWCVVFTGFECPPLDNIFDTQSGLDPENGTDSNNYALTFAWDINDSWTFKSITGYRDSDTRNNIDFDTTPLPITDVMATYYDNQTSQEFQMVYDGGGKWSTVLGLFYLDGEAGGLVQNIFFGSTFGTTDGTTYTTSYAFYGDASYRFNDKWTLNFGLRPTKETKRGVAYNALYADDTFTTPIFVTADYDKEADFDSWAPRVGVDWQINPEVMTYFTLSNGFKSGGFNVRAQSTVFPDTADAFDDEVLTMGEIGIKSVLANHSLVLNAAIFYGDYEDIQVSTFASYDSTGDGQDDAFYGSFLNAGNATLKGVELEMDWASGSWYGISGNASYLDAKPDEFLDEDGDGFVDTQVITNAPEFTGQIRFNINFPLFGGTFTGSAGYAYRDDSVLTNEGGPDPRDPTEETPLYPLVQESFGLLDAWVSWLSGNNHWRIGLTGKNLTDEEYLTNGYNIPVLGVIQGSYGAPQRVIGTFSYIF